MKRIIEAIENMVSVEEAAHHCPKCAPGAFCVKHDEAFWSFWGQVKRHLTSRSSRAADTYVTATYICPECGGKHFKCPGK